MRQEIDVMICDICGDVYSEEIKNKKEFIDMYFCSPTSYNEKLRFRFQFLCHYPDSKFDEEAWRTAVFCPDCWAGIGKKLFKKSLKELEKEAE